MRINFIYRNDTVKKRTSIGNSGLSRPKNKNKRRSWKKYRGQGKCYKYTNTNTNTITNTILIRYYYINLFFLTYVKNKFILFNINNN